jgi:hypothetical protein
MCGVGPDTPTSVIVPLVRDVDDAVDNWENSGL